MPTTVASGAPTTEIPFSVSRPSRLAAAVVAGLPLRSPYFECDEKDERDRREVEEIRAPREPRCPGQAALLHAVDGRGCASTVVVRGRRDSSQLKHYALPIQSVQLLFFRAAVTAGNASELLGKQAVWGPGFVVVTLCAQRLE